ncbi:MAG: stalk domain-containing protein [Caldiserica bacterium]|nr:stalk domain-containing protein [Caldisericota bacterium]
MNPSIGKKQSTFHIFLNQRYIHNVFERIICSLLAEGKRKKILKTSLSLLILLVLSIASFSSGGKGNEVMASTNGTTYGPELQIKEDWIIDNETVVVTSEQPISFVQSYHEQYKIIVKNGGVLKIIDSYIRSDFRFLLELYDTSKLIVENSNLGWQKGLDVGLSGAVITNMDNSVVEAKNSELDLVGIANGNGLLSYTTVDLDNCRIEQLELDLFDLKGVVIDGLSTGNIEDRTFSSEKFRMKLKNCVVKGEVTSWIGDAEVTFKNCKMGQISPDEGSIVNIENCTMREIVPRVSSYSGVISGLPQGNVSSFQLNLPEKNGPSINVVNSTIENGWRFRYFSGCNIEFRNCYFSVLSPMGNNYASVYDSTVREVWLWWTSGEIHFENSPIGWIGKIMGPNNILLSGYITVEDKNWQSNRWVNNWGDTIIRREFFFSFPSGSADCIIKNEEGTTVDQFVVGTIPIKKVLTFDKEQRNFKVYLDGILKETLELSSDSDVAFRPNTYTIKATSGVGGSILPSGSVIVNPGTDQTFTITPDTGYHIKDVKVDGNSVGAVTSYTFTNINSDHTISVEFILPDTIPPTVTLFSPTDGTKVSTPTVNISGKVTDNVGVVAVWVGAKKAELAPDGTFSEPVSLDEGINTIKVVAFDASGNKGEEDLIVNYKKKTVITIILQIGNTSFTVNGIQNTLDSPPVIKNDRTLLPIRVIVEALGGTIEWIPTTKSITIRLGSTYIGMQIGNSSAVVNGYVMNIDSDNPKVVPEIINSRTMLPLRFVTENLGCDVQWDGTTKTITITYPKP